MLPIPSLSVEAAAERLALLSRSTFVTLPKIKPGDQVAIVSPSSGLPGRFPAVFEQGLKRISEQFGLVPREYPTTRRMGATLQDRAQDLMNAFSDPANKAVISSIGGNDQIRLLKHLDPQIFLENPKPFLGYSDNTNLALYLWRLGIPSYYGGAVMCQFGLSGAMQALTVEGVNRALFKNGRFEIKPSANYTDRYHNWEDVAALSKAPIESPSEGWYWDGESVGEGILWGGCLEILAWQLEVNAWLPKPESLKGCILCLETSEEMPPAHFVERTIVSLGERGLLENFSGLLMARPKAWEHEHPLTAAQSEAYRAAQRDAVQRAFRLYNKSAPLVMNVEFGHTDPQHILPIGQKLEIDAISKRVWAHY